MTTGIIVLARMASTRLPGKVLADVGGSPMLDLLLRRLGRVRRMDALVVASTCDPEDDRVLDVAAARGWDTWTHCDPSDTLGSVIGAARRYEVDTIVRVTADCPLLDPATVEMLIARHRMGDVDYAVQVGMPDGAGCEVVTLAALDRAAAEPALTAEEREHVTLHVRRHPERYRLGRVDTGLGMDAVHWSVDEPEDLAFVRRVVAELREPFSFGDVLRLTAGWSVRREMPQREREALGILTRLAATL